MLWDFYGRCTFLYCQVSSNISLEREELNELSGEPFKTFSVKQALIYCRVKCKYKF